MSQQRRRRQLVGCFLWLGTVGFGGPIALAGHMQQDLVDERSWVPKEDYVEDSRWPNLGRDRLPRSSPSISATFVPPCSMPPL